ncbi:flagellar biosynthetic protein FliO [Cupriavidus gilardii]|uniref:flagellar biosynthetic protein FliO n=1 Tax=Cupriavidus gilardii TaxID=82541 RepID=UPI00157392C3|nr:flagellar biosynthetic protein FliO [Cupriavidus gilardii]NSX03115.1 flagellar biosynthetic protein FliO [Cupriavidus gilardii]
MKPARGRAWRSAPGTRSYAARWICAAAAGLPAFAHAADAVTSATGAGALAQAGLGLFAIIALILGLAWLARRAGLVRHVQGGLMKVVGSTSLGARQRLLLVEVGDTWLVLGVSAGEIRTLHTLPAGSASPGEAIAGIGGMGGGMGSTHTSPQAPFGDKATFAQKLLRSMQQNLQQTLQQTPKS